MRPTVGFTGLLMGALSACAIDTGQPPRLSYAPPDERPTESGSANVGQPAGMIWNQLLDRLIQASLQIDPAPPPNGQEPQGPVFRGAPGGSSGGGRVAASVGSGPPGAGQAPSP